MAKNTVKLTPAQKEDEALRRAVAEEQAKAVEWMEGIDPDEECDLPPAPRDDDDDTVPF